MEQLATPIITNGPLRVLVCDDEPLTALHIKATLSALGCDIVGLASDGEQAVRLAVQLRPDAILMDVNMPGVDGMEALQQISREAPTAVVMLTAYTDQETVQRALSAGASGYLVKPFRGDELLPAIAVAQARFRELQAERSSAKRQLEAANGQVRAALDRAAELWDANQHLLQVALREEERADDLSIAARAKDEFLAILAHELRNPLAAIGSAFQVLQMGANPDDARVSKMHAVVARQLAHETRLLDDLLDLSRVTRGKIELQLERVDLADALQHSIAESRALLDDSRHLLSVSLPDHPVWMEADPVRLHQIVTNLLQNAIKYMDPGGQIWLTMQVKSPEPDGVVAHRLAELRIRDAGVGISPEALPRVFELFMQVDPSAARAKRGLGIGLSLVKQLVELHGGSVEAHSEGLGHGSEFRVEMPLCH